MADPATRVIWKPVRDRPTDRTWDDSSERTELGACVVIHVDQMPAPAGARPRPPRSLRALWSSLRAPPDGQRPAWEEHRGVVDQRTAERIAAEFGVGLEIG